MRKKIYVMALALCCAGMGLMYSCKSTEAMEPLKSATADLSAARLATGPVVSHGWLNFQTPENFNATMKVLHDQYEAGNLGKWEAGFAGQDFISLRRKYELIDADTSEYRRAPTVDSLINANKLFNCPDSWFATVLNKDGYIQIADTVYSFRPGAKNQEAYAIPAKYAAELRKGMPPPSIPGVKLHKIFFDMLEFPQWQWPDEWHVPQPGEPIVIPDYPICQYPSGNIPNWWGQSGGDIYRGNDGSSFPEHNGRQVKLNYHRWRVGYIFYASAGVRVKMLKHTRFAGWQSVTYADEMVMDACVKGKVFIPGLPLIPFNEQISPGWPNFARYAENNFEKTMKWTASGIFNEIILEHFNFHFRVNYRGRIAERYIRQ